jgi:hypothetical protein
MNIKIISTKYKNDVISILFNNNKFDLIKQFKTLNIGKIDDDRPFFGIKLRDKLTNYYLYVFNTHMPHYCD